MKKAAFKYLWVKINIVVSDIKRKCLRAELQYLASRKKRIKVITRNGTDIFVTVNKCEEWMENRLCQ